MIKHNPEKNTVTMSLVDLEHCGFDADKFDFELRAAGITEEEARWPVALIVNFAGGQVSTPKTPVDIKEGYQKMVEKFKIMFPY